MGSSTSKGNISTALLVITLLTILFLVIILAELMISPGVRAGKYSNPNVATQVVRGTIYDRSGRALAIEVPQNNLYFIPSSNSDEYADTISQILAVDLNLHPGDILSLISKTEADQNALIKRELTNQEITQIKEDLEKNAIPPDIIKIQKEYVRTYPTLFHAAQLVQETETVFNRVLSPYPGFDESTTYGNDVYLTIDLDIQYLLDLTVQQVYEIQIPDYAVAFVLDIATGEMLASTTYPFYNLNESSTISDAQKMNRTLVSSISSPELKIDKVKTIKKVTEHGSDTVLTDYALTGSFTIDADPIKAMVDNPDGNTSILATIPAENPKYLVFIGSVNPKSYQISSVLEYAVSSLSEGLASQTKL